MSKGDKDLLDRTVAFLQKRDGIDKTLKILRYSTKILLATSLKGADGELVSKLKAFESSVGTSRKAFRLGKFLQDVNTLRKTPLNNLDGVLELVASGGEGVYYFVEQFVWLVKAGAIEKRHGRKFQKISAWAEFIGYFGSVALKTLQVARLLDEERVLQNMLQERAATSEKVAKEEGTAALKKLETLQFKRFMKSLALVQDLADSLLALNDIWEDEGPLARPALLAGAGMMSALISAHKNWLAI